MVRTLDASLTSALSMHTRYPALTITIEDHVAHYALYQTPATADALSDACSTNDNALVRLLVTRSGFTSSARIQRIADPTQASQWSSWTTLPGASGVVFQDGGCAITNWSGVLHAFAQRGTGGNNLWVWTSTDNGVSWSGPLTVLSPPGGALLKGITSAGNNDVFFLYDVVGGEAIGYSFYNGVSWSALTTWTLPTIVYGVGLAAAWSGSVYTLIYSDGYSLLSGTYTPASNTWGSNLAVAPATTTAVGRIAPRLSLMDGLYTLCCIEVDSGLLTGAVYSYPRLRQSSDLLHWSNGFIVHDLSVSYGANLLKLVTPHTGSAGPRYYLMSPPNIYSAVAFQTSNSSQYIDVSATVLSYQRHEQVNKTAQVEVVLDNAGGIYDALLTTGSSYRPLGLHASLVLSEGYMVGSSFSTVDVIKVGSYRLVRIQIVRSPQDNKLLLTALDLSSNLDLVSRYQNIYVNQTVGYLVQEICTRAGLFVLALPVTTQVSQIVPTFVLQAGQAYRKALDELCSLYGLDYFLDQNEVMQFRELASGGGAVWSYQPELEMVSFSNKDERANHIIVIGKPPVGGLAGALTTAEAYDDGHLHLVGVERIRYHVDHKLTSSTQCSQKASFLLAQEARSQTQHQGVVPANPALQLLDAITLSDSGAPVGSGQSSTGHIVTSVVSYDAQQGQYEMRLTLEG